MDDFLSKPFSGNDLATALSRWVGHAQSSIAQEKRGGHKQEVIFSDAPCIDEGILDDMQKAMGDDFVELIPAVVESIKSASINTSAVKLSSMAENLETEVMQGAVNNAEKQVHDLKIEFDCVCSIS